MSSDEPLHGVGLGLRWDFLEEILDGPDVDVAFFEVSPENYMRRGGYYPAALERIADRYRMLTHGLTMSFGAMEPPDPGYLDELKTEVNRVRSPWHTDHLCFSTFGPRVLHDLLPLKLCAADADRSADHVSIAQDRLGLPLGIENVSWYAHPGKPEMAEEDFITRVLERADCFLLLDVNNVYVNSVNHGFDAKTFIDRLPLDRVRQLHVAGHRVMESGLLLDTHGAPMVDPVYDLLEYTIERTGPKPVLLERDNNVPDLSELLQEVRRIRKSYERGLARHAATSKGAVRAS